MKYRGRIPYVDPDRPEAWGKDDLTGLPVMYNEMVDYIEYIGTGLTPTGFRSHYSEVDEPNPQLIPPRMVPDPVPVAKPRFFQLSELPEIPVGLTLLTSTPTTITVTWTIDPTVESYVVAWNTNWTDGEADNILAPPYTITALAPLNPYLIYVASVDSSGQSAFSDPIQVETP